MNFEENIIHQLQVIRQELAELKTNKKDILTFDETCEYLNVSSSFIYKLTSNHLIPCYQPNGKKLYFKRQELDEWLLRNRKSDNEEIEKTASNYIQSNSKRKGGLI